MDSAFLDNLPLWSRLRELNFPTNSKRILWAFRERLYREVAAKPDRRNLSPARNSGLRSIPLRQYPKRVVAPPLPGPCPSSSREGNREGSRADSCIHRRSGRMRT